MADWLRFGNGRGRATFGDDFATVGDRIAPSEIQVEILGGASQPDMSMKIEVRQGIPVCTEVCLRARQDGPEVREKDLAQVRIAWLIEQVVAAASWKPSGQIGDPGYIWAQTANDVGARADIQRLRAGRSRMSQERLQKIAAIYREHINDRPTEAVERAFGVSHRTAARYVQLARSSGLLPATSPGKKKA